MNCHILCHVFCNIFCHVLTLKNQNTKKNIIRKHYKTWQKTWHKTWQLIQTKNKSSTHTHKHKNPKKYVNTKVLMFLCCFSVFFYQDQRDGVYHDQSNGVFIINVLSNILKHSTTIVEYHNVITFIRIKVVFYCKSTVEYT